MNQPNAAQDVAVNILCIGDVVGNVGRQMVADLLPALIDQHRLDLVVCNAENAAGGSGLTPALFQKIRSCGVDVVTMGDHAYRKGEIIPIFNNDEHILRPANLPAQAAGRGWTVVTTKDRAHRVGVSCLLGQMYMTAGNSPWASADQFVSAMGDDVVIRVVDFHAEASSEKIAMGWHLNGRASIVFGTHTHVPTADARLLDGGTAFISDVGMTGPYDSILGRDKQRVLRFLTTAMPQRFDVARGDGRLCGLLVGVEPQTGRAVSVERIEVAAPSNDHSNDRTEAAHHSGQGGSRGR